MEKLLADILKAHETLSEIKFKIKDEEYTFYYKYMTILEHTRIKLQCTRTNYTIDTQGTKTEKIEVQEHLMPIYTILEKALDKEGKKLFSLTNKSHFDSISKMPMPLLSHIAAEMQFDITGNLSEIFDKKSE